MSFKFLPQIGMLVCVENPYFLIPMKSTNSSHLILSILRSTISLNTCRYGIPRIAFYFSRASLSTVIITLAAHENNIQASKIQILFSDW